jgi:hypothetical protein
MSTIYDTMRLLATKPKEQILDLVTLKAILAEAGFDENGMAYDGTKKIYAHYDESIFDKHDADDDNLENGLDSNNQKYPAAVFTGSGKLVHLTV